MLEFFAFLGGIAILVGLKFLIAYFVDEHETLERVTNHMDRLDKDQEGIYFRLYRIEEQIKGMTKDENTESND